MGNVSSWKVAVLAVSSIALAGASHAAEKEHEASVFGSLMHVNSSGGSGSSTTAILNGSYGWLLTPHILVSADVTELKSTGITFTGFGASGKYYFGTLSGAGAVTPYGRVEAHLLRSSGSFSSGTGSTVGAFGGLDIGITESTSVFVEAGYERVDPGSGITLDQTAVYLGLAVRF